MFVRDGFYWRYMPMLSPDDNGGGPDGQGAEQQGGDGGDNDFAGGDHGNEHDQNEGTGNEELAKLRLELARQKEAINKATKEAADYKRQLRAKQSAEEIAAEEKKAQDEAINKEIEELRREVAKTKAVKTVMSRLGTDEETSGKIAEYLYGAEDVENALTEIQRIWAAREKALRLEFGKIPAPGAGGAGGEDAEMQKAIKLAKEIGRERAASSKSVKENLSSYVR